MPFVVKVQLFWEGCKNLRHPPYGFDIYLVNVKTIRRMAQIFVAFLEKLNFKYAKSAAYPIRILKLSACLEIVK